MNDDDEDAAVREELGVGGVGDRGAHRPDEATARVEAVDPAADLGDEQPPSGSGVSPFGLEKPRGGSWAQTAAEDPDHRAVRGELDDAAVLDVGTVSVAVREAVGVVGRVQVAG